MSNQNQVKSPGQLSIMINGTTGTLDTWYDIGGVIPKQELVLNSVMVRLNNVNTFYNSVPSYTLTDTILTGGLSSTTTSSAYSIGGTTSTFIQSSNANIVFVELPWLSADNLLDGNKAQSRLPLFLSGNTVTMYNPQTVLALRQDIPRSFRVACYDWSGALFSPIAELALGFNYFVSQNG